MVAASQASAVPPSKPGVTSLAAAAAPFWPLVGTSVAPPRSRYRGGPKRARAGHPPCSPRGPRGPSATHAPAEAAARGPKRPRVRACFATGPRRAASAAAAASSAPRLSAAAASALRARSGSPPRPFGPGGVAGPPLCHRGTGTCRIGSSLPPASSPPRAARAGSGGPGRGALAAPLPGPNPWHAPLPLDARLRRADTVVCR